MSITPNRESRDGQSASNRVIVKSNIRRTGTDRSPGNVLRPVFDLNPTPPWPPWHRRSNRRNIGDASRATILRNDTKPTNQPTGEPRRAVSTNVRCCLYRSILLLIGVRWSPEHQCNFLLVKTFVFLRPFASQPNLVKRLLKCLYFGFIGDASLTHMIPQDSSSFPAVAFYLSTKSSSRAKSMHVKCIAKGEQQDEGGGGRGANYRSRHDAKGRNRWKKTSKNEFTTIRSFYRRGPLDPGSPIAAPFARYSGNCQ